MTGGYLILDLHNAILSTSTTNRMDGGVFDEFDARFAADKAVMVSNIVIDNVQYNDVFVELNKSGTIYQWQMYGYRAVFRRTGQNTTLQLQQI